MASYALGGCGNCTEHATCVTYDDGNHKPTESERQKRSEAEQIRFKTKGAELELEKVHARDAAAEVNNKKLGLPEPRNKVDSPWCNCDIPLLEENRRQGGIPPASIKANIQDFVDAVNEDRVEYIINDREGTQAWIDETTELLKVNMIVNRVDTGTWLFIPALDGDEFIQFYGVIKTRPLGFQMSGPRSYCYYKCQTCCAGFKIGYTTKHFHGDGFTQTWEWDRHIDQIMGIKHLPIYRPTFKNDY